MKNTENYQICVNTTLLDTYLYTQDENDKDLDYIYTKIENMFMVELSEATCIEDIYEPVMLELKYIIEREASDIDPQEVIQELSRVWGLR